MVSLWAESQCPSRIFLEGRLLPGESRSTRQSIPPAPCFPVKQGGEFSDDQERPNGRTRGGLGDRTRWLPAGVYAAAAAARNAKQRRRGGRGG
uniref:Uncharacterized protein n=1 Tax=Rhipicephalus appendiculatus TaxID=34631 RepID=A0A131YHM8_RHIAP